jgi:hypothetical protein
VLADAWLPSVAPSHSTATNSAPRSCDAAGQWELRSALLLAAAAPPRRCHSLCRPGHLGQPTPPRLLEPPSACLRLLHWPPAVPTASGDRAFSFSLVFLNTTSCSRKKFVRFPSLGRACTALFMCAAVRGPISVQLASFHGFWRASGVSLWCALLCIHIWTYEAELSSPQPKLMSSLSAS